ncbi:MAG: proline--tRNA ligase [Deltaproteobacteria bacterium]|nr:proline--tRNA ligase [Deltaproteobacteria bacterium]
MRYSRLLIPTLKEDPAEAEVVSHRLMMRAGMIRKLAAGIYTYLPLGYRVVRKVERIIREEMDRAGAQEVLMPAVQPASLWKESGRWDHYGKELLRVRDRKDTEFCIGPTHEEVITDLVRMNVRSYRELPLNLYQIQTKFRDEIRPRFGLMRGREFIMKDAYSFDRDEAGADESYRKMYDAYCRIFERCGLAFRAVEADTGTIGGNFSHEFMVMAETGEDAVACCDSCGYAANTERAEIRKGTAESSGDADAVEEVETPGKKSVEEVAAFLKIEPERLIKTLIVMDEEGHAAVGLVRGDHELNEIKLKNRLGWETITLADEETVQRVTGGPSGFSGPVGLTGVPVIADHGILFVADGVTGANRADLHLRHVRVNRDFAPDAFEDIRIAREGDGCPRCDGTLRITRGIEVGHIFKLGTKYSEAMGATFLNEDGKSRPMIMGCYGIGVGRTAAAAIEQNHDDDGIIWPIPIAPFTALILPLNMKSKEVTELAEKFYDELTEKGVDVLLDDRNERPGFKFKDADLIGIPRRIVIGDRGLREGVVEIKERKSGDVTKVPVEEAVAKILS